MPKSSDFSGSNNKGLKLLFQEILLHLLRFLITSKSCFYSSPQTPGILSIMEAQENLLFLVQKVDLRKKLVLSYSPSLMIGIRSAVDNEAEGLTSEAKASANKPKVVRKNNGAPIIEDWVSDSEEEDVPQAKKEKKTVKSSFAKIEFVKSKEQVKTPRKTTVKQGSNFEMTNKACYVCGSFDHMQYNCDNHQRQFNNKKIVKPVWNYSQRVNHQNFSRMTHPSPKRNMVPKAVLMRSGLVSLTTARSVNTAQPKTTVIVQNK
ncbi:ribonuclease H-like domain-containing protein [Tanacetum coccineum]